MTGDDIRGMKFPRAWRGYAPQQVDDLLLAVARMLDAGFPPPPGTPPPGEFATILRGYDRQAVDRFFDTLARDRALQPYPLGAASPWGTGYEEPQPSDNPGTGDRQAEWRSVADLPGTRLRRISGWTSKITDSHGQVLMTCHGKTLRIGATGQVLRNDPKGAEIVDAATGTPVLRWIGNHSYHRARAVVLGPGQSWLRFPVQGSRLRYAVMRAVDQSGTEVMWFRKTQRNVVEAVTSPDRNISPETLCLTELAAQWLRAYFSPPDEGGGG